MLRINWNEKPGTCQPFHSNAASRKNWLTAYLRWLLIVGFCISTPTIRRAPRAPARLSKRTARREPSTPSPSPSVTHPGVLRPFSDALHLWLRVEPDETLSAIGKLSRKLNALTLTMN